MSSYSHCPACGRKKAVSDRALVGQDPWVAVSCMRCTVCKAKSIDGVTIRDPANPGASKLPAAREAMANACERAAKEEDKVAARAADNARYARLTGSAIRGRWIE